MTDRQDRPGRSEMRRSEVLQKVRRMRFEGIYERCQSRTLSCEAAAELLGASVSTFFHCRQDMEHDPARPARLERAACGFEDTNPQLSNFLILL